VVVQNLCAAICNPGQSAARSARTRRPTVQVLIQPRHALPSLLTHLLTTRFHTASSLEEGTRGSLGDLISYSQVAGREKEMIFLVKKLDFCGWLLKTETASLLGH
jgi:hypothetical protein